ncbi:hypothetical protein HZS_7932 [Henneguya salminicola]|nr:hypothetical protein HZS_7932 [Henneguya salminicola]
MSFKADFRARISEIKKKKPNKNNDSSNILCSVCNKMFKTKAMYEIHQTEKDHLFKLKLIGNKSQNTDSLDLKPKKRTAEVDVEEKQVNLIEENTIASEPRLYVGVVEPQNMQSLPDGPGVPEGFFDDPIQDAKARKVKFVDRFEAAYEKFQNEIKNELTASDQMFDVKWEETEISRDEMELECMDKCIKRMYNLRGIVETHKNDVSQQSINRSNLKNIKSPNDSDSSEEVPLKTIK